MEVTSGAGPPAGPGAPAAVASSAWRESVSIDERKAVIRHLFQNFQERPGYVPSDRDKLLKLVSRIEERLWVAATSRENYLDPAVMHARIRELVKPAQRVSAQVVQQQQAGFPNGVAQAPLVTPHQVDQQQGQGQGQHPQQQQQQQAQFAAAPVHMKQDGFQGQPELLYPGSLYPASLYAGQQFAGLQAAGNPGGNQTMVGMQQLSQAPTLPACLVADPMAAAFNGNGVNLPIQMGGADLASTAESGLRHFMTNGAPVLLRGGGGMGSAPGMMNMPGAAATMPLLKIEGGGMIPMSQGGGMIPVSSAATLPGMQQQQQQPQQQATATMGGMVPLGQFTGGVESNGNPGGEGTSGQYDRNGSVGDLLGTSFAHDANGSLQSGDPRAAAARLEHRKQQILKQQRWLLFLRHCARCGFADGECYYGQNCAIAKQLWQHLIACKSPACTYPRCSASRELLKHHQRCKSPSCPVCGPVKQYVNCQREETLRNKLKASGMAKEEQKRYMEHMAQRRAAAVGADVSHVGASGYGAIDAYAPVVDAQAMKRPRLLLQENMGTSLIEYFSEQEIQKHIDRLHLEGAAAAPRRQAAISSVDDFGLHVEEESCCRVCHQNKLTFEPPSLYCYRCGQRVKRNQTFLATPKSCELRGLWCNSCVQSTPGDVMQLESFSVRKIDLDKKKNDDEQEEGWVQCDFCEGWVHQICGLFNKGRNNEERGFLCPHCLLAGLKRGQRSVPKERPQAMLTARDLPRCELSDFIEERIQRKVREERVQRAKALGRNIEDVPTAEGLCIRLINNVRKTMEVKPRFAEVFCGGLYPETFPYTQKVLVLFQQLDGVDMCLYCLYLQEYGQDSAPPNQRVVYLSYLDSVKYFQPEAVEAAGLGVALRTLVYHEILLGYLQWAKCHGYCSMYIWACPPMQGDDYILYCHPGRQKTPRSDRLREWYLAMLRRARSEGSVVYISNLYDTFFEGGRDHRIEHPSVTDLPYLEGDYWPGEAENLLTNMNGGGDGDSKGSNKGRKGSKGQRWRVDADELPGTQLLTRLGETIQGMKEDFIVVHLYESCSHCRAYINDGMRYYHPSPPQKVVIKSEKAFDGIALDRPGADSSRTVSLGRFQLCQRCYDREGGRAADGARALGLPAGIVLTDLEAAVCPKLPSTHPDGVALIDNEFFDTRNQFLSLCQGNHYQFDTLRRARHSSMMVLYHLHNPSEPAFSATCNLCQAELKAGEGYRCMTCSDFDMCAACHAKPTVTHPHPLVPQKARKFDETRMRLTEEDRANRNEALHKTMALLVHASACNNQACPSSNCAKVKALFNHAVTCQTKITGGCTYCRKMWALLQAHSKMCNAMDCPVPRCRELRQLRRQQATRQEDARRKAYRKMLKQQAKGNGT